MEKTQKPKTEKLNGCRTCGALFTSYRSSFYCSQKCKQKAYRLKHANRLSKKRAMVAKIKELQDQIKNLKEKIELLENQKNMLF